MPPAILRQSYMRLDCKMASLMAALIQLATAEYACLLRLRVSGRCGDAAPSALLMKCLAGAARLACAEPACCAGGLSLGLVFYSCQSAGLPPVAGRWRAGCIRLGSFAALIVKHARSSPAGSDALSSPAPSDGGWYS